MEVKDIVGRLWRDLRYLVILPFKRVPPQSKREARRILLYRLRFNAWLLRFEIGEWWQWHTNPCFLLGLCVEKVSWDAWSWAIIQGAEVIQGGVESTRFLAWLSLFRAIWRSKQ